MGDAARRRQMEAERYARQVSKAKSFQQNLDYEPCDDLLLLEQTNAEVSEGGIHIPESARADYMPRWRVLKVGPGRVATNGSLIPMRMKVGMEVLIQPDRGGCYSLPNTTTQFLCSESVVIAIISERSDA